MASMYKEYAHMLLADNSIDRIRILIRELVVFDNRLTDPITGEDMSLAKSKAVIRRMIEVTRKKLVNPLTHRGWVTDGTINELDLLSDALEGAKYKADTEEKKAGSYLKDGVYYSADGAALINWNL
tara:strand:+ start:93 stop:470 length:378 start_codon:yes stop_codon:yes gene_type:complete